VRLRDLIGTALGGLWRQKARTSLTLLGVAVGGCALAFSLSLGIGLRAMIDNEFQGRPGFWIVQVHGGESGLPTPEAEIPPEAIAVEGNLSEERKARLKQRLVERYQREHPKAAPARLTREKIAELAALPDVAEVETWHMSSCNARLGDGKSRDTTVVAGKIDRPTMKDRLVIGRIPVAADEALVSEALLYELGVHDEAGFANIAGRTIKLSIGGGGEVKPYAAASLLGIRANDLTLSQEELLAKVAALLKEALEKINLNSTEKAALANLLTDATIKKAKDKPLSLGVLEKPIEVEFRITGVVRALTREELRDDSRSDGWELRAGDIFLSPAAGDPLFDRFPWIKETGYRSATVHVRRGGDLRAVVEAIDREGFEHYSSLKFYDSTKREVTLISAGLNLFALISLFVAALGITNTLVTSVLERTREIGILKALGATDRQVMSLFLTEGALVGLVGGLLGLVLAWILSIPGNRLVRHLVEEQSHEKLITESVFDFPLWLSAGSVLFAMLVTTLAAVYPARRAARIQPVEALRHD